MAPCRDELARDCVLDTETARSFAEQGLGVAQLALCLALTAEGLTTSLQHCDALLAEELATFLDLAPTRFRLGSIMPFGYADETISAGTRRPLDDVVGRESGHGLAQRPAGKHE
jgi:predicted oxidoreductase (fatty acid repression mutant protein)